MRSKKKLTSEGLTPQQFEKRLMEKLVIEVNKVMLVIEVNKVMYENQPLEDHNKDIRKEINQ